MDEPTSNLALFAASKDQTRYFSELAKQLSFKTKVVHYKSLWNPLTWGRVPLGALKKQAELLVVRKQHSKYGKYYPSWVWSVFVRFYQLRAYWLYGSYQRWLHSESAEYIGVWNGKKFRQAILVAAIYECGKQPIFFETGPLPGKSAIDPKGVNAFSSIPRELSFYEGLPNPQTNWLQTDATERPTGLPKQYVFVPFQVVEDSNIYLHSKWIRTMRQLFDLCESLLPELPDSTCFVFKPHPACNEDYSDLKARETDRLRWVEDIPSTELVVHAEAVVTINSTVGIEALAAGKKVFVLGDALFAIPGITYPVSSADELQKSLKYLEQSVFNVPIVNRFLEYLNNDYAIPGNAMREPGEIHWRAAQVRIEQIMHSRQKKPLK